MLWGKLYLKKKRIQLGLFWRINKIRNVRLPLLTSRKMISAVEPWVPDLPGALPYQVAGALFQARAPVKFILRPVWAA